VNHPNPFYARPDSVMKKFGPYISALRPVQWTKNLFVLAALFFSKSLVNPHAVLKVAIAFFLFCLVSGCTYIFNDLCDRESDRKHPVKSKRPIASGEIGTAQAVGLLAACLVIALTGAFLVNMRFFIVCIAAIVIQVLYSLVLKKIVILDVFIIALAFVLRVVAGGVAINVEISSWILICTLLLALFLALGKRRHELVMVASGVTNHRKVLEEYTSQLLDQMTSIVAASTVISYALYTVSDATRTRFHTENLIFTIPFVLYGIFRYLYLIHRRQEGGYPENILISDKPLYINILLWVVTTGIILYVSPF
jgi:4-hydroxybenzoate polyprenyltransferase